MADNDQLSNDLQSLRISREDAADSGRSRAWIPVVGVIAIAGAAFAIFGRGRTEVAAAPVELGQVQLISPSQADVKLVATGYVVSKRRATLAAKTPGRLLRLHVDEGDRVTAGQVVAEVDRADVEAQIASARADVALAKARVLEAEVGVKDAELKATRERELQGRGAGTKASVDDADARVAIAKAQVASARANVEAIETRIRQAEVAIENTRVRAPFDGTVLRKLSEIGEVMNPTGLSSGGGIITIASLAELQVEADVSETQLAKVLAPTEAKVNTTPLAERGTGAPAEIVLDAFPDRRFRGQVVDVRPTVDRAKATVVVKVKFVDPTGGVLPDMSAKVSFLARAIEEKALEQAPKRVVAGDAVVERDGRKVVFTIDKDDKGRVRAVPVSVKGSFGSAGLVELAEGPPPGASVVRSPPPGLADGARVKLPE